MKSGTELKCCTNPYFLSSGLGFPKHPVIANYRYFVIANYLILPLIDSSSDLQEDMQQRWQVEEAAAVIVVGSKACKQLLLPPLAVYQHRFGDTTDSL